MCTYVVPVDVGALQSAAIGDDVAVDLGDVFLFDVRARIEAGVVQQRATVDYLAFWTRNVANTLSAAHRG